MPDKDRFLSRTSLHERLPVFFQPWWLDRVSSSWNIALAEEEGIIKGIWPYSIEKKLGLTLIRNPLLTPYLGPWLLPEAESEKIKMLEALWQQLPAYDSFDMETTTAFAYPHFLQDKGFQLQEKVTYEIGLQETEERLFAAMNSNHRSLIRQAAGCHHIVGGKEYIPQLIQLHEETFRRKKKAYPFSPALIIGLVEESIGRGQGRLLAARDEQGAVTAAIFIVWDQVKMYLLLSAADMSRVHPGAVRLLIWEAIKSARQHGLQQFDFEGSMDPGIAAFFRRFGGDRKVYLCFSHYKSLLWRIKKQLLG